MLKLDEPSMYNWNIKFNEITPTGINTIIEGDHCDYIPLVGDVIVQDDIIYIVKGRMFDFDTGTITISMERKVMMS